MEGSIKHPFFPSTLAFASILTLSACGSGGPPEAAVPATPIEKPDGTDSKANISLRVLDTTGAPIADASVLIGPRPGTPFAGNVLRTDSAGGIEIPAAWTDAQPVTIEAPGFLRVTYMARPPTTQTLRARPLPSNLSLEVSGQTKDFGRLSRDGWVDVGLVLPAASRSGMINFQIGALISPSSDTIRLALGKSVEIPSNIALPKQSESYVLPITFDKPGYRVFLPTPGLHGLVALHGRFPIKTIVDELREGRSAFDILNHLDMKSAGTRDVTARLSPVTRQDISVNRIPFSKTIQVRAPAYDPALVMVSLALFESGDMVFPSDIKKLDPGQALNLKAPAGARPGLILNVLRARDTSNGSTGPGIDEFTAVLQPDNLSSAADFIPLARAPALRSGSLVLDAPAAPETVAPAQTYALHSRLETRRIGQISIENKVPEWEVFADGWSAAIDLPEAPSRGIANAKYRWEVLFLGDEIKGGRKPRPQPLGPAVLETVTHVSKNAVDHF